MTDQMVEQSLRNDPITLALYRLYRSRGKSPLQAWEQIVSVRPDLKPLEPGPQVFFRVVY